MSNEMLDNNNMFFNNSLTDIILYQNKIIIKKDLEKEGFINSSIVITTK